jgi:signal transduction histidine kinase/ligand-binding sensor protein
MLKIKTGKNNRILSKDSLTIPDFCDMDAFDQMMRDWSNATGLATVAVGKDGHYLTGYYNFTDFCEKMNRRSPEGLRRCIECDKKGKGVYLCHAGLFDFAAPITLEDGTILGNIVGGQVLPEKPDEERFRQTAREIDVNEDEYIKLLRKVNIRTPEQIKASFDLLTQAVNMFVRTSFASKTNNQSLLLRSDIISSFGKIYFCSFFIDMQREDVFELDAPPFIHDFAAANADLDLRDFFLRISKAMIYPEYQKDFEAFVKYDDLGERLKGKKQITYEYIGKVTGWCRAAFIPVRENESGLPYQVVFTIQNIAEEKKKELEIQKSLKDAAEEAQSANRAKTDFLSRMSHDIRTPINGIIGMTYLASQEKNPEKTREYLKKIDTSSKFLLGLINDILDMTKVESNKITLHPEPYPPEEFENYISSVILPLCDVKKIRFNLKIDPYPGLVPLQDKLHINQIVFNLLSNSIKFSEEGGKIDYHALFTKIGEKKLLMTLTITDNGIGMSEEFMKTLFTPFSQEGRSDNNENRGSGLGLAIVKRLVELMGGEISAVSKLKEGTTFILKIPLDAITSQEEAKYVSKEKAALKPVSLKDRHILLFEDNLINQEIVKTILEKSGAVVETASNGLIGIKQFKCSTIGFYDLILMDVRMPVMDGIEATKGIRNLERKDAKSIPIIAMTADAFEDDEKRCRQAGMNGHIAKPIDPENLLSILVSYLK